MLAPHFVEPAILALADEATETLTDEDVAELYDRFIRAREQAIIAEIRKICGIELAAAAAPTEGELVDDLAPDLVDQEAGLEDELADLFAEQATA